MATTPKSIRLYMCPGCGEWDKFSGWCDNRRAHPGTELPKLEPVTVRLSHEAGRPNGEVVQPSIAAEDRGVGDS